MNDKFVESWSLIEAGPIIEEALRLRDLHCLGEQPDERKSFCVLGLGIGPLVNHQVTYLLNRAVERMLGSVTDETGGEDFYIHATIHQLYCGYTRRFLERSFMSQPQRDAKLEGMLQRLVSRNLEHAHHLDFATMSSDQWSFSVDVGLILLQREFPTGSRPESCFLEPGHRRLDHDEWLGAVAFQMQQELAAVAA